MTAAIARRHHCTRPGVLGVARNVDLARVTWTAKWSGTCRPEEQDEDDHDDQCSCTSVRFGGPRASRRRTNWWAIRITRLHDDCLRRHRCDVRIRLLGLHLHGRDAHSRLCGLELRCVILGCHQCLSSGSRSFLFLCCRAPSACFSLPSTVYRIPCLHDTVAS